MNWREAITDALLRTFTPETHGQNFGAPQDDIEGWQRAVMHQRRLHEDLQKGIAMPPDPRMQGWRRPP